MAIYPHPTFRIDPGVAFPDGVPGKIRIAILAFQKCAFLLHAGGIDIEEDRVLAIVKGVEEETNLVVVVDLLAAHEVASKFVHLGVESQEDHIEGAVGVAKIGFGAL